MFDWLKKNRSLVLRWAGTIISAGLLAWLAWEHWAEFVQAIQEISFSELALAFFLMMASRFFVTLRWYSLLRFAGIPIRLRQAASLTFTGLFANNFMPTTVGGDVIRLAGTRQMGFDQPTILASLAADRLVNMAGMSLAAPLGLIQLPQLGATLTLASPWQKGLGFLRRTLQSLTIWLRQPASLAVALTLALAHMLCMFSANYVLIHALGGKLMAWQVIGLFSMSYFLGLLPVSIGGYGWQEITMSAILSQVGGESIAVSTAVPLFHRLLLLLASLPGAWTLPGILASIDSTPASQEQ